MLGITGVLAGRYINLTRYPNECLGFFDPDPSDPTGGLVVHHITKNGVNGQGPDSLSPHSYLDEILSGV